MCLNLCAVHKLNYNNTAEWWREILDQTGLDLRMHFWIAGHQVRGVLTSIRQTASGHQFQQRQNLQCQQQHHQPNNPFGQPHAQQQGRNCPLLQAMIAGFSNSLSPIVCQHLRMRQTILPGIHHNGPIHSDTDLAHGRSHYECENVFHFGFKAQIGCRSSLRSTTTGPPPKLPTSSRSRSCMPRSVGSPPR
jgi:hypothetical protein